MMKLNPVLIACALLFLPVVIAFAAETKTDITMRLSKNEGVTRIVFEDIDDAFIKNTDVTASQNQLKVHFPAYFNLKVKGNLNLDTSVKEKALVLNINSPFKIKVLRLSSPARLSIDIMTSENPDIKDQKPVPASPVAVSGLRIVIDAGHGGYDIGLLSGDLKEKDATLSMARDVESALTKKVKSVFLTRRSDQFLSFNDRAVFANQKSPDIFISLHLSASENIVIYTIPAEAVSSDLSVVDAHSLISRQLRYIEKSIALREAFGEIIKDEFKDEIIFREIPLPLLKSIGAPAVMIEVPKAVIYDKASRAEFSNAILKGITSYANQ